MSAENMHTKTLALATLLPHRDPIILLSAAVDYGEDFATAVVYITEASPFFDAELGGVPSWVGMEYMAQTIGIWAGHQRLKKNSAVRAGFLLGCRRFDCQQAVFPVGSTLQLSCRLVYRDDNFLGAFDCSIRCGDVVYAAAQIKAISPDNPEDFVRKA